MTKKFLILPLALFLCAASNAKLVEKIEAEIDQQAPLCADFLQQDPPKQAGKKACLKNGKLVEKLREENLCWGPKNAPSVEKDWIKCDSAQIEEYPFKL
ncbi:hypothetical protein FAI40_05045 [Acetobacteraceae bacterium]|nr:hypothetical protein FAI40_05045 [Acetobacteraceae bacterium]